MTRVYERKGTLRLGKFKAIEVRFMRLLARQLTNLEIAHILKRSTRTIEGYREELLEKTKAKNSVGIVLYAIRNRLIKIPGLNPVLKTS